MRLLVLSDSHGKSSKLEDIIAKEKDAKHIFFLGDVVRDIENIVFEFPDRVFHIVAGNCDYFSEYKTFDIATVGETKILFTHGHNFYVKSGENEHLTRFAAENGCAIALYGHTHIPDISFFGGIITVNPGSVGRSRDGAESYAVIDIENGKIIPKIIRI